MKTQQPFDIWFEYPMSENILIKLTARVQLHHSDPYYVISDFFLQKTAAGKPMLPEISIKALRRENGISWVHTDSGKETILSMTIGKAIEAYGNTEVAEN